MWLYYYWIALTGFVSNQSLKKNHFIKWWDCKFNCNLCHLSKKCLFSWLYICNAPVSFSAYTECNNTKEHGLDQCTTRSFWSGPGSPMWFPSVGQATPNPPTIPLVLRCEKNTTGIVQRMTVLCHCSLCQKSLCRTTNRCSVACEGQCQIHELKHPTIPSIVLWCILRKGRNFTW